MPTADTPTPAASTPAPTEPVGRQDSPARGARRRPARRTGWRLVFLTSLVLLGIATAISLATLLFGRVAGREFSPESLETRSFSYYEIPLLQWQVSPVQRQVTRGGVEQHLRTEKLVEIQPAARWDLVDASRLASPVDPRGASILMRYFEAWTDQREPYWERWSVAHPELAQVVWPEVLQLARRRLYVLIPEVMREAQQAAPELAHGTTPSTVGTEEHHHAEALRQRIHDVLRRRLDELSEWHRQRGPAELAEQLRAWGAEYEEMAPAAWNGKPGSSETREPQANDAP